MILFFCKIAALAQTPANDLIENAIVLDEFPFIDENVDIFNATSGGSLECFTDNKKIWYKYQPTEDIVLAAGVLNSPSNADVLGIFISSVPNATDPNQLTTYPDANSCIGYSNRYMQKTLIAGSTYYIVIKRDSFISFTDTIDIAFNISQNETINFPDPNLEVLANQALFISNSNNQVELVEALIHTQVLNVSGPFSEEFQVQDPTGLEFFFNASGLDISNNSIQSIDLTSFPKLELFWADNNELNILDISQNPLIEFLRVPFNELTELDLTQNNLIKMLQIDYNQISDIDFAGNPIEQLSASNNLFSVLDVSNLSNLSLLDISGNNISTIDLSFCPNLLTFNNSVNPMSEIDLSQNLMLEEIEIRGLPLTELDLTLNTQLKEISLARNSITELDLTQNTLLEELIIFNDPITELDLSQNTLLREVFLSDLSLRNLDLSNNSSLFIMFVTNNYFLESINLKNGSNNQIFSFGFDGSLNPNLEVICVDDISYAESTFTDLTNSFPVFVEDCSLLSSRNTIEGTIAFDLNDNGCDTADISLVSKRVVSSSNDFTSVSFTDNNGLYKSVVLDGSYTTEVELQDNFDVSPSTNTTEFLDFSNTETLDFCVTDNALVNDLSVVIIPLSEARPGFDASYKIIYENIGSTTLSGSVTFQFDDSMQMFVSSIPTVSASNFNSLTFDFVDILPFEQRLIDIKMNTFTPPIVNGDDILNFSAQLNLSAVDAQPENNLFQFAQVVVNSFDPNDKTVLEGEEITLDQVDDFLHYVVRFQNTGTASAVNVIILDELFFFLDVSTFQPISASHDYTARIVSGNIVEFSFENIFLPAQQDDDAGSNGYVAFKIKPFSQFLNIGDVITGSASIYFDFNAPIITNTVFTEIVETLSVDDFNSKDQILLYPNPTSGLLNFNFKGDTIVTGVTIIDSSGRDVLHLKEAVNSVDLSKLASGIYFVRFETNFGIINRRLIKN